MKENMELVAVRLTKKLIEAIDDAVSEGHYPSRSEFIREATRKHLNMHEPKIKIKEAIPHIRAYG